jgi:hypothetical protein
MADRPIIVFRHDNCFPRIPQYTRDRVPASRRRGASHLHRAGSTASVVRVSRAGGNIIETGTDSYRLAQARAAQQG